MHYDFIEIGTADFDYILQDISVHNKIRRGICVEPIFEKLDKVLSHKNVYKLCAAIGARDGLCDITYIPTDKLKNRAKELGLKYDDVRRGGRTVKEMIIGASGSCIVDKPFHPFNVSIADNLDFKLDEYQVTKKVPIISVETFVKTYDIEGVDYLKIDAEGMDFEIIWAWMKCVAAGLTQRPKILQFEFHETFLEEPLTLTQQNNFINSMANKLELYGYNAFDIAPFKSIKVRGKMITAEKYGNIRAKNINDKNVFVTDF